MPIVVERVTPSIAAELAWLLDLLVQTVRYAAPALGELDRSLLPGIEALRPQVKDRYALLWDDSLRGCPELLVAAGSEIDDDARQLLAWFSTRPRNSTLRYDLISEPAPDRRQIRRRLALLASDIAIRRRYRDILAAVWQFAGPVWERRGRGVTAKATDDWSRRLASVRNASELIKLMPPRHPLAGEEPMPRRRRLVLVPIYFCMSGGSVTDLGDRLVIGVPASALDPVRRSRDAAYVADRARLLAEPTRVSILIHVMTAPSGVMEISRALRMSQPAVSEHVRVLAAAGLIRKARSGSRTVYFAPPQRTERIFEDARATLMRWAPG